MAEPPEAFVGIVLADRYELSSVLGAGQGGMVFKARHRQLDRFVAVKLLSPENMSDKTAFMRFEREAHSIGRLNHPNIVTVFDVGRWKDERPYLVMDYIEGQDLQDLMGKEGRIPIVRSLRIVTQVCSALYHAHKRGVIHRDLKPRNIMVIDAEDVSDFVKLVDFGIAKQSGSEQFNEGLTLEGYVVGTPQYMSPEQCTGAKVDERTDIYALAGVLFRMITGLNPIQGDSIGEIMNNQIHQAPMSFEKACNYIKVPSEIQKVIYKGLSKNAEERQESMAQFRQELNEAFARVATQAFAGQEAGSAQGAEDKVSASNMDTLRERAVAGDVIAQYELVLRLEYGQGCKANPEEARRWLMYAAQKGMKEAQWRIGDHLLRGEAGYETNPQEAVVWLTKSADQGYDSAQFALGWCHEHGLGTKEDLSQAAAWYQKASKQGNAQATERLRTCVDKLGQAAMPVAKVSNLIENETESNDPETLYSLACKIRDSGKRGDDKIKAANMFKRAALFGHDLAQIAYISLCLTHPSSPEEQKEAVDWLEKSSAQNNERAMLMHAACLRNGIAMKANSQKAQSLIEDMSKNLKNLTAQTMLGASLLTGDGLARNIPRGINLLKQAADDGDGLAQWKLAICYRNGLGVMKDSKTAEALFQKAADAVFPQGVEELWKPSGLQFAEVIQIFKSLCSLGNRHAYYWLGICFENGIGLDRDTNQALKNYEEAHAKGLNSSQKAIERIKSAIKS